MNLFATGTSATTIMTSIASSTTTNLGTFAPIFEIMAGLILAMALIAWVVSLVAHRGNPQGGGEGLDFDAILPDDIL